MNRKEVTDYTAGYDDCIADMMQMLDEIKAEIEVEREKNTNGEYDKIFELCLLIIDKHIGGEK